MIRLAGLIALGCAAAACSCRREPPPPPAGPSRRLSVVVSIPPQAYLVERIGGEHVEVEVLVGPGQNPHVFEPTPKQMARLSQADLYFRIGVPFEDVLAGRLAGMNDRLRIVDTCRGIARRRMTAEEQEHEHADEHGAGEGGHEAGGDHHGAEDEADPHTWLSPRLAAVQAQTLCDEMCLADPARGEEYRRNLQSLRDDLSALDRELAASLAPLKGKAFYVFHPAFGYFAEAYGLRQVAVETGGKSPSARHLKELIDRAKADGVKVIFVQPQFSPQAAKTVAEQVGGVVVPMDDLARDYLGNLRDMAAKVRAALGPARP